MPSSRSPVDDPQGGAPSAARARVDAVSWALIFIWVGVAILANAGWGWFLAGLGAIVLAAQAALSFQGEKLDGFWLACGAVFAIGGVWQLLGLQWPLAPVLLILLGASILWRALFNLPDSGA